ncbi:MAG TPA: fatty acid desaturase [Pseudomonadales bacterium]|nr:fatty acid desaturase [Pseudomonadales bacterium]
MQFMALSIRFKDEQSARYQGGAVIYLLLGYVGGISGLTSENIAINFCATILLGHSMTIAAYMVHECAHNTVFKRNQDNARLGIFLTWICGASYGTFEDIRYKHFRHHVDNDDVVWFDYEGFFTRYPNILKAVKVLEFFYIPAHDIIMHGLMIFAPFIIPERRNQRSRTAAIFLVRAGLFVLLCLYSFKAAVLYVIAYMLMMTVLRFMDGLQHDYDYHLNLYTDERSSHKGDLVWEQVHTYSNVISFAYHFPNWLVLNFGFHNAHHAKPTTPWFRLPDLHRQLFGDELKNFITLGPQLIMFHRHRVSRIMHDDATIPAAEGLDFLRAAQQAETDGGNAASFLTSF